jgi:hypothetical protein
MDIDEIESQIKKNMKNIQEIINKNKLLEEKVEYLELELEKTKDQLQYLEKQSTFPSINDITDSYSPSLP